MNPVGFTLAFAMLLAGLLKLFGFEPRNDPRRNGGQGLEDFKLHHGERNKP